MNLTMQCQKRQRQEGISEGYIGVGEDGLPYADDSILIVADGLGGRGGFSHTKFKTKDIFEPEKFYDVVMKPVLGEADAEFRNYVADSFRELFALKDVYFTGHPGENKRTSGYFASRLVSAIVLHTLKYDSQFSSEELISSVLSTSGESRSVLLSKYGNSLQRVIHEKLQSIASNNNLETESKTTGSYLLPSTLTVALLRECEDHVDVIYFWAGDSRAYVWNKYGLAQVTKDHEENETMTNLICLSKPFFIETKYLQFEKPCILFNTTDGCYKPNCFSSPLDFEYVLLDSMKQSRDMNEFSEKMRNVYKVIGNDDSDTMALAAYGYEDFDEIRRFADERLQDIQCEIIDKLPDIFDRDYTQELNDFVAEAESTERKMLESLVCVDSVRNFIISKMNDFSNVQYEREKAELEKKQEGYNSDYSEARVKLENWISEHWIAPPCLRHLIGVSSSEGEDPCSLYEKLSEEADKTKNRFVKSCETVSENIQIITDSVKAETFLEGDKEERKRLLREQLSLVDKIKSDLKNLLSDLSRKNLKTVDVEKALKELNEKYAKEDSLIVKETARKLINEGLGIFGENANDSDQYMEIKAILDSISMISQKKEVLSEKIRELQTRYMSSFIKSNAGLLFDSILGKTDILPDERRVGLLNQYNEIENKKEELIRAIELRDELYASYERNYMRYLEGAGDAS